MERITPDYVLSLREATTDFLCRLSANTYGIEFLCFRVRDMDSGMMLFEVAKEEGEDAEMVDQEDDTIRTIRYHFGPDFLKLRAVGSTLQFKVGPKEVRNFRMIERHYFRDRLLKNFDFTLDFCIPNSVNTWEVIYDLPLLPDDIAQEMIANPWETKSDSFYFVEDQLIMHNKAEYSYAPFD